MFGTGKPVYVLTSSRTFSGAEEFSGSELHRIEGRVRRLNALGFDIAELDGTLVRLDEAEPEAEEVIGQVVLGPVGSRLVKLRNR